MKEILLIGLGGGVGAIFRYLLSRLSHGIFGVSFPFGTLIVNVLGAFLIGTLSFLIFQRVAELSSELRALLLIGLLGGFTTFSTFSLETIELWENGETVKTALYILLSVGLCLLATWGGGMLAKRIGS
ncbi:MAG: putative fluoride ion transporter CrcB [Chlamydiae bacterium]|nr:putative fluoride ion transporter CrcB [Chlamydiota bacterium]